MNSLKNMKIGKRLIISFIVVTVLASASGILGLVITKRLDKRYSEALVVNGFAQGYIGTFNTDLNKSAILVRDFITTNDVAEREVLQRKLDEMNKMVMNALEAVKKTSKTPDEMQQISIIDSNLSKYAEVRTRVVNLVLKNRSSEAMKLFREEANPLLEQCMKAADTLAEMNVTMGNRVSADLTNQSKAAELAIIVTIFLIMGISFWLGTITAHAIADPLEELEAAAKEMANGNLKASIGYQSDNELGILSDSMRVMIERIRYYMGEISDVAGQLAAGDLDVKEQEAFLGDFLPVQDSLTQLVSSLNDTMSQINQSADQVSAGSDQVASGAQALSQGATEQASSVQELAATINDISFQVQGTAENSKEALSETNDAGSAVADCNRQMQDMIFAMSDISEKSAEIGKIIKTIEDIAFQTNILALNAAVEAARAGAAGKGFAVVADEVRNLAGKSSEASKNTSDLIAGSVSAVERGTQIANGTAESLLQVVEKTRAVAAIVDKITTAASEQASSIAQVTQGIDQISSVVQTNSATAEESAAASEELSSQSQIMKKLVSRFKLRGGRNQKHSPTPFTHESKSTYSASAFESNYNDMKY